MTKAKLERRLLEVERVLPPPPPPRSPFIHPAEMALDLAFRICQARFLSHTLRDMKGYGRGFAEDRRLATDMLCEPSTWLDHTPRPPLTDRPTAERLVHLTWEVLIDIKAFDDSVLDCQPWFRDKGEESTAPELEDCWQNEVWVRDKGADLFARYLSRAIVVRMHRRHHPDWRLDELAGMLMAQGVPLSEDVKLPRYIQIRRIA